jgi:hypothetical protein
MPERVGHGEPHNTGQNGVLDQSRIPDLIHNAMSVAAPV